MAVMSSGGPRDVWRSIAALFDRRPIGFDGFEDAM